MNRTYLQEEINVKGILFRPYIKPIDNTNVVTIKRELKAKGIRHITVNVLSSRLKGKTDLWGKPYKPTVWIYTDKNVDTLIKYRAAIKAYQ